MPTLPRSAPSPGAQRLTAASLRALSDALPLLYSETKLAQLPRAFADALVQLIPGESHGVVVHDRGRGKRFWHLHPATAEYETLEPLLFENIPEFASANYRKFTGSGEALALSDVVGRDRLERLVIYNEHHRHLGLEDDFSIDVQQENVVTCAAVLRRRCGFRQEERELMNALRPHFKQAWANAQTFAQLSSASAAATLAPPAWSPEPLEVRFGLTPREAEVLLWVAQGKTNTEVGSILSIRSSTVRTHLERVFSKLGVETRHAAGLRAIEVLGMPRELPQAAVAQSNTTVLFP